MIKTACDRCKEIYLPMLVQPARWMVDSGKGVGMSCTFHLTQTIESLINPYLYVEVSQL